MKSNGTSALTENWQAAAEAGNLSSHCSSSLCVNTKPSLKFFVCSPLVHLLQLYNWRSKRRRGAAKSLTSVYIPLLSLCLAREASTQRSNSAGLVLPFFFSKNTAHTHFMLLNYITHRNIQKCIFHMIVIPVIAHTNVFCLLKKKHRSIHQTLCSEPIVAVWTASKHQLFTSKEIKWIYSQMSSFLPSFNFS